MTLVEQFQEPADFWKGMVLPDSGEYQADPGDLRKALHLAISLFHMHDWVFNFHEQVIMQSFTFVDRSGNTDVVDKSSKFANYLGVNYPDFELIRGIANAAKHLQLTSWSPNPDTPTHSANLTSQSLGGSSYGIGPYGGGPQIMLKTDNADQHFSQIAKNVETMWTSLNSTHCWW